jgi:hypothetical protein
VYFVGSEEKKFSTRNYISDAEKKAEYNDNLYPKYHHVVWTNTCFYAQAEMFRSDPDLDRQKYSDSERAFILTHWRGRRQNNELLLEQLEFSAGAIETNKKAVEKFDVENPGTINETIRFLLENLNKKRLTPNDWEKIDETKDLFMSVIGLQNDPWYLAYLVVIHFGSLEPEKFDKGDHLNFYKLKNEFTAEEKHETVSYVPGPDGKMHKFSKPLFLHRFYVDDNGTHKTSDNPFKVKPVKREVSEAFVKNIKNYAKTKHPHPPAVYRL